jgi:hypothetical protein
VAFCPSSLTSAGGIIVALTRCSRKLSTCCTAATPRMLFSHQHTLPPSLAGVAGSAFRRATAAATFRLVMLKAGSCYSPSSFFMARLASNADSRWSTLASLAFALALLPVSLP